MLVLVAGVIGVALFLIGMGQNLLGTQQVRLDNLQQELTVATLQRVIREAGREPVQRDSYYRHIGSPSSAKNIEPREAELACA